MKETGVYLASVYDGEIQTVEFQDPWGTVCLYLMPFLKPATVRWALEEEDISTYEEAVAAAIRRLTPDPSKRNVLVSHQFVAGAARCDSEEIFVGGLDQVSADLFAAFDYVALGHLHSPQRVERETVRYCGSPLKYSFSEASQDRKSVV